MKLHEEDRVERDSFGRSEDEVRECAAAAAELLRCVADNADHYTGNCKTLEVVALELDCSLFVTLLARLWAQHVAALREVPFENDQDVCLEAAFLLEAT